MGILIFFIVCFTLAAGGFYAIQKPETCTVCGEESKDLGGCDDCFFDARGGY